jgi:hypothetical protein
LVAFSVAAFSFSGSVGAAPPAALVGPAAAVLGAVSPVALAAVSPLAEELSLDLVVFVDVVDVDVVCAAEASALVSVGGVISGVLLGTESETVVLPQAANVSAHASAAQAANAARALTTVPYACRTSGSR